MRLTDTLPSADENGATRTTGGLNPSLQNGERSPQARRSDTETRVGLLCRLNGSSIGDLAGPLGPPVEIPGSKPEKDAGCLQQHTGAAPEVDGPINGSYPVEATNHGVQNELKVHHKDDGIEVVQQEVDYEMGEGGEDEQGEKVDDKDASMSPAGKSKYPADGDDTRGRSPTRRILRRRAPGRRHSTYTDGSSRSGEGQPDPEDASGRVSRAIREEASGEAHKVRDMAESKSPKRRGREDSDSDTGGVKKEMRTTPMAVKTTHPLSPIKRGPKSPRKKDRFVQQKYMHLYLLTKEYVNDQDMNLQDVDENTTEPQPPIVERKYTKSDNCKYVGSSPANDAGATLGNWIAILGGNLVDMAATGHCGWLAGYAALYNVAEGVHESTVQVVEAANAFKKQVLNGMLATLEEEMRLHLNDLDVELEASGIRSLNGAPVAKRICALANHYVAQRQKSVKAAVPMHFWVRPAHIKAMAIHARETIYVLDVDGHGTTRAQAYAYNSIALHGEDAFDSGTNQSMPTQEAMKLLEELVAITYDADRYDSYVKQLTTLAPRRNAILKKHGRSAMDYIQYDPESTTKAAARALKAIRKQAKSQTIALEMGAEEEHSADKSDAKEEVDDTRMTKEALSTNQRTHENPSEENRCRNDVSSITHTDSTQVDSDTRPLRTVRDGIELDGEANDLHEHMVTASEENDVDITNGDKC
ncbi:unnamed protein product [Phytophthora fragariaefolia]|uniref:Unnamed protein product n=1 Tax=Phytophthora fragariaefolia TaxID=1490495 RepID=A0A9W6XUQ9_9STRA|nr:unnamed protein product [Phytophthora fragariaefolia]